MFDTWNFHTNSTKLLLMLQGHAPRRVFKNGAELDLAIQATRAPIQATSTPSAPLGGPLSIRKMKLALEAFTTAVPDCELKAFLVGMSPHRAWRWTFGEDRLMEVVLQDVEEPLEREKWRAAIDLRCSILREIFANPLRPRVDPHTSLSESAWTLARGIEEEAAFDRLPILADAVEECGWHDAGLLEHLRGPESHRRGCWALDRVLGLE